MAAPETTWQAEAGIDVAAELLTHFDRASGTWDLPEIGEFWDAVHMARSLGRDGEGRTIALIDDGFDLSYPSLAVQSVPWGATSGGGFAHGTAVALLVLAVAPKSRLILYPVAKATGWDPELIESALRCVASTECDIINLSLGRAHPVDIQVDPYFWSDMARPWLEATGKDLSGSRLQALVLESRMKGWRYQLGAIADSSVGEAVADVVSRGHTVIAAAGNSPDYVFEPAVLPGVYAAAFHGGKSRNPQDAYDRVRYVSPTFEQAGFFDFVISQPPEALGSSFAAPLISGFVALMKDRKDLARYQRITWGSSMAGEGMAEYIEHRPQPWDADVSDWLNATEMLYKRSLAPLPEHSHEEQADVGCPECSLFALGSFINFSLFELNTGNLGEAEKWLLRGLAVSPASADILLLLGRLYAVGANGALRKFGDSRLGEVRELLDEAAECLERGLAIQSFEKDKRLLHFVRCGQKSVSGWLLPKEYLGWGWELPRPPESSRTGRNATSTGSAVPEDSRG